MSERSIQKTLRSHLLTLPVLKGAGMFLSCSLTLALNLYDGTNYGNKFEINLPTTFSYTGALRLNSPSTVFKGLEDGTAKFERSLVTDLFSAVPLIDFHDGRFGAHMSGQLCINT